MITSLSVWQGMCLMGYCEDTRGMRYQGDYGESSCMTHIASPLHATPLSWHTTCTWTRSRDQWARSCKTENATIMPRRHAERPPAHERWMPRHGERYDLILGHGTIHNFDWQGTEIDRHAWGFGNCFSRRRDAEYARDQLKELLVRFHQDHP